MKLLIIFLFMWSSYSHAKVIGKVSNALSDSWLNEVKVVNIRNGAVAFTNEYGSFEIDAVVNDQLVFSLRGFEDKAVIVPNNKLVYALLEPYEFQDTGSLNSLLSTGGRQSQTLASTPASVVVISQAEISQFGYQTLTEVLNHVSGLYLVEEHSWTGSGQNVGVRGYMSSGVNNGLLIMINGVAQYEDYWGQFPLTRADVPVQAITRVEVVKGPMSVVYGNQALLGTINIITRADSSGQIDVSHDEISYSMNNLGDMRVGAKLSYEGNSNHTLTFGASYDAGKFDTKALNTDSGFTSDYNDSLSAQSFFLGLSSNYRKNLVLNANFSQAKKGILADLSFASKHFGRISGRQYADINGTNLSLSYRHFWLDDAAQTKTTLGYFSHNSLQDYASGGVTYGFASYRSKAIQLEWEVSLNGRKLYQMPLNIRFGGQSRRALDLHTTFDIGTAISVTDRYISIDHDDTLDTHSMFFQLDYQLNDKWLIDAGVRAERVTSYQMIFGCKNPLNLCNEALHSANAPAMNGPRSLYERKANVGVLPTEYTPRVAVIYKSNDSAVLKLIYGVGARNPSFGQNADVLEALSAKAFKREQVKSWEFIYLNQFSDDAINLSVSSQISLYYSELNGLIVRHGLQSFARTGAAKGAELSAKVSWGQLFARLGINYYHAEDYQMDNRVPSSPEQLAQLRVGVTIAEGMDVGLSARYLDKMYNSFSSCTLQSGCTYINPEKPYSDSAYLVDVSFKMSEVFGLPVTSQFGVKNLFGTNHTHPVSSNNAWLKRGFPAEPRQVFMSFKYQL
ncbi:hypothetical protein N474_18905 [Pseudoalteromonas luteoviolacea CPMOR-2]|uniref:TonB-dependent receptor plug domain-containing protein n=1 Tax=Pseudoalteromonas luteoviolacea TaxID=43657 RepID=UPI0007B05860|nr:TonB-dependent receptor [Pseudoalteromonas luteoviolacea]KZN53913.1 hypothetical protein N474_18905 [Pseudoalteromonas luteoviolacea CPMOR-2]